MPKLVDLGKDETFHFPKYFNQKTLVKTTRFFTSLKVFLMKMNSSLFMALLRLTKNF